MEFNELTEEQKKKARNCTSSEEILAFAEEEGIELTDDQLESVSGGSWGPSSNCDGDPDYRY